MLGAVNKTLGYIIVDATYNYAKNSISKVQEERFLNTLDAIRTFKKEYRTDGDFDKDLEKIEDKTKQALNELSQNTSIN